MLGSKIYKVLLGESRCRIAGFGGGSCICNFEQECHLLQDHPDKLHAFSYYLEELYDFVEVLPGLRLVSSGAALFLCHLTIHSLPHICNVDSRPLCHIILNYAYHQGQSCVRFTTHLIHYWRQDIWQALRLAISCQLSQALQCSDQSLNFYAVYDLKQITIDLKLDVLNTYLASVDAFATFYAREI